uniref:Major Surface Glycoprotein type II (MSR), putative n=1 Tax=Pneumocystis carinii TaxID=4754 RepID=Q6AHS2_PNECA|nr:Major Surface Glycoprotein type II (MSR), putative [Pneumocystis carinii]
MFFSIINKIIVLGILILIVPTYGNQSTHLKTRDSKVSIENTPFKDIVVKDEEIVVYILQEDYEKDEEKCKSKLKEYCEELKGIDSELNKVHSKIKEICGDIDKKCRETKAKIQKKVEETANLVTDYMSRSISYKECDQYYQTCMFYEPTKEKDVLGFCSLLRYFCYFLRDTDMRNEVILRAVSTSISGSKDFAEKRQNNCPTLIKQSNDLALFCLEDISLENFNKSIDGFCNSLNDFIDNDKKEEVCHEKLGIYPLLKERCEEKNEKLKELCKVKNITYRPPVKDFNPIEPEMTLLEDIDLENLYKEGRNRGLILGALEKTLDDMLIFLSRNSKPDEMEEKCNNVLNTRCTYLKTISSKFMELCENSNKKEKCKDISKMTDRCTKLRIRLYVDGTSTKFKDNSELLSYDKFSTSFTEDECLEVMSDFFFIRRPCEPNMNNEYQNIIIACYKKKEDQLFIKLIGSELYKLNKLESNDERFNKCQKIVLEKCATFKNNNVGIFMRCLRPKEICLRFEKIISSQLKDLEQVLNTVRDSPNEKDCIKLKEDCEGILKDLGLNNGKCVTLKERCEYFKVTRELKYAFLKEKSDALADNEKCMKALKDKCDKLPKVMGGGGLYHVSCALPEETCKFMVSEAKNHCNIFKKNLEKHEIVNKTKNVNKTLVEETCVLWDPYCDQLMENCPETLKNDSSNADGKGVCLQLKENCVPFWEKKQLEDGLTYLLRGNLGDASKCKETLEKYCAEWKAASNETFNALLGNCNDTTKEDVCKKLVEKVKKMCLSLKTDLEKAKNELIKNKNEYEKAKQVAKESRKKANLLLSIPRQTVTSSAQNSSGSVPAQPPLAPPAAPEAPAAGSSSTSSGTPNAADGTKGNTKLGLVKRAYVAGGVSEAEVKAFDDTAIAMELYLELNEECKALELDCGFKEDCSDLVVCGEIDTLCKGIKPLEVMPYHTETIIKETMTVTMTETKTIDKADGKTGTKTITIAESVGGGKVAEQCTLVRTTDIWVTSTSLHTSTVTSTPTVTSTVTLTSMRKCKPTKCTTDSSRETDKGEEGKDEEDVKPNDGMKIRVPDMIKIMLLGVIVMGMM